MAVIINDFEITLEPPAPSAGEPSAAQLPAAGAASLRPEDVDRIVKHFEQRRRRVAAD
ncbi:MAG TPA: hypothetical protein VII06_35245 [Chloroflexota bacterium]|jgi:hypothetical protein